MVDLTAAAGAMTSIRAMKEIASAMVDLRDAAAFQEKKLELQALALDAQAGVFAVNEERAALMKRVDELEAKVRSLENWEAEKERYQLKQVSSIGTYAYVPKMGVQSSEPPHSLCANCFGAGKKSILQAQPGLRMGQRSYACQSCGAEILMPN